MLDDALLIILCTLSIIFVIMKIFKPSKILNIAAFILYCSMFVLYIILKRGDYLNDFPWLVLVGTCLVPNGDTKISKNYYKLKFEMTELAKKYGETAKIIYNVSEEDINELSNLLKDGKKVVAAKLLKDKYNMYLTEAFTYIDCFKNSKYFDMFS